jgi:ribonucleoside-diphosphate reductase alpha chain
MISHITKRDGKKELFTSRKIFEALKKAFIANNQKTDDTTLQDITDLVVADLDSKYGKAGIPSVEHVQDIVELMLLRSGHIEVAKAYILYRAEHKKIREDKVLTAIREQKLNVLTASGASIPFNPTLIERQLESLTADLGNIDKNELIENICRTLYNEMPLSEVRTLILNGVKSKIEVHYDYSKLASRVVLDGLYKSVLETEFGSENLQSQYQSNFEKYIEIGIDLELLNPELKNFDLKKISQAIVASRDLEFFYLGMQTITDRYLLRQRNGNKIPFELPQWLWMRVAMGMSLKESDKEKYAIQFYNQLSQLYVISSTPTLFNSGTTHSQMSSCYLNTVEDSMKGIFKNYSDNAQLSKWAGGIGTDWTPVRSKGADIIGTNGSSQGIVPFLKIYNDVALAVNQGGKRKGAMCAYLEVWHSDIDEFLELKKNTGDERRRAHDIHTALFINDLFMKRVREKGKWTLFSPDSVPGLHDAYGHQFENLYIQYEHQKLKGSITVEALELWRKMLTMLYETGHPWITFKDPMNIRSPQDHVGVVHNSNLCTEITLNTSADETAVCNLASINLARMITGSTLNEPRLCEAVTTAMRMLDNVIDNNFYPVVEAQNSNLRHRPVGLGVMGYQDALYQLGIEFDSDENVDFSDTSMELISHAAILASSDLAAERGSYPSFAGSKWDRGILPLDTLDLLEKDRGISIPVPRRTRQDWDLIRNTIKAQGMRNSNCMAIAPTATISNIAGTVPCVEPAFKNLYMKENLSGNFVVINRYLVDALVQEGLWNKALLNKIKLNNGSVLGIDEIPADIQRRFKETFEIDSEWILQCAARRSKWIDQSASTNIFIKTTSGKILASTYMKAWELGLKTTYYLRSQAASQISKTTQEDLQDEIPQFKACSITDPDCEACQ